MNRRPEPTAAARLVIVLAVVAALAACATAETPPYGAASSAPPTAGPTDIDPALLQPLTVLGPCTVEPNVLDEAPAEGALLPDDAVLTSQERAGPLTTIKGYVPMTPIQVRVFYQRHPDVEVIHIEDEIRESEALLGNGDHRLFVKAQAICEQGSTFLAVVAPETQGEQVPVPAGAGG